MNYWSKVLISDSELILFKETYPNYAYYSQLFIDYCNQKLKRDPDIFSLKSFGNHLKVEHRSTPLGTYNVILSAAKALVRFWYELNGECSNEVEESIKQIKGKLRNNYAIPRTLYHTWEEIDQLLKIAGKKTTCLIYFLVNTGLRVSELTSIRKDNCFQLINTVEIRFTGKENKERSLSIAKDLYDLMDNQFLGKTYLIETIHKKPYTADQVSRMIRDAGKKIGIVSSAHRMRHTFATGVAKKYPSKIKELAQYLGHSSYKITLDYYVHDSLKVEDIEACIEVKKPTAVFENKHIKVR